MGIGDWVHTCHKMNKITGFVTNISSDSVTIHVTIPLNYGILTLPRADVWEGSDTIWMDDIPTLIDLSLMIRDEQWFKQWLHELSLWRPVNSVLSN